ncbi:MAG: M23 family metallopeptidase [Saccharofermentanales bacterium]
MRRQDTTCSDPVLRYVTTARLLIRKYQRPLIAVIILCTIALTASGAFAAGRSQSQADSTPAANDRSSLTAFENRVASRDNLALELEKINLVNQLNEQKALNEHLTGTIEVKEKAMDSLEDTILNSLLANLDEKTVSRSGDSLNKKIEEARNLTDLSKKLKKFKSTPEAERIDLTEYEAKINSRLAKLPTLKPIAGKLEGYGPRTHPIFGYRHFHGAVDMGAPTGTPIKAAAAGRIIAASRSSSAGNFVKISHSNGFVTSYLHCSKLNVNEGDTVNKGDVVGLVGNTGNSTKPHLHFSIEFNGEPLNPASIIME